ncbi:MFS transporter [Paracoccus kondratievae]
MLILLVGAIGFGGLFAVYSYLSAAMLATTQPPGWAVPATLSAFGIGGTLGSIRAARLTMRYGTWSAALRLMLFMAITQAFASFAVGDWRLMLLSSFVLGLGSGMVVPLQTRLMDVAGEAQSMAAAMNHAAFNAANALGPWLAGLALAAGWGWRSSGLVAVGLSGAGILALWLAWRQARLSGDVLHDRPART